MKIVNVLGDNFAFEVLPRAAADAITCIDGWLALGGLCAQIGTPGLVACACALRQFLTMPISAFDAAEVGALARPEPRSRKTSC